MGAIKTNKLLSETTHNHIGLLRVNRLASSFLFFSRFDILVGGYTGLDRNIVSLVSTGPSPWQMLMSITLTRLGLWWGVILPSMVVTRADQRGRSKRVQPGNREWATVIQRVNADGWCIPPFIILQGAYHLANWYSESNLPPEWVIGTTHNRWTNNETGLKWIQHFDKYTASRIKGAYRMLLIDGHEIHHSAKFDQFCKDKNIIIICMPPHSSRLLQPLDVGCFSPLKRAYSRQIEGLIKSHINHVVTAWSRWLGITWGAVFCFIALLINTAFPPLFLPHVDYSRW